VLLPHHRRRRRRRRSLLVQRLPQKCTWTNFIRAVPISQTQGARFTTQQGKAETIYKFQKNKGQAVDSLLAHFCAALGVGRLLEFLFWLYCHKELANHNGSAAPGYFVILAQLFQLAMMAEFFYFYFKAVKSSTPLVLPVSDSFV